MSARTYGVGVVGAGNISSKYLQNLCASPELRVLFIADLNLDLARSQAERFGVAGAGTVDELLAREDVDVVVNLTIPAAHFEVAERALRAGKHVWNEKPLATSTADGARLVALAAELGLRVSAAPDTFLGPGLQGAFRHLADGSGGAPESALVLMQSAGPDAWHPNPEFLFQHGAGPLFDIGPYYLTALVQIFGPVSRVFASTSIARPIRTVGDGPRKGTEFGVTAPTHVGASLEFERGGSAQLVLSFESSANRSLFEVNCTTSTVLLPNPVAFAGESVVTTAAFDPVVLPAPDPGWGRGAGVVDMVRCIEADVPQRASGELALHVLDVMESILRAGEAHEAVDIATTAPSPELLPAGWDPREPALP